MNSSYLAFATVRNQPDYWPTFKRLKKGNIIGKFKWHNQYKSNFGDSLDSIEKQLYTFLWEARYVILFYFFGDVLSTLYALHLGCKEGNRIVVTILRHFGPIGFTLAKLLPVCCLFYYFTMTEVNLQTWEMAITLATVLGFFATTNNMSIVMDLKGKES